MHCQWGKKIPKLPLPFLIAPPSGVGPSDGDRQHAQKCGKDRALGSGNMLADRQTDNAHTHTHTHTHTHVLITILRHRFRGRRKIQELDMIKKTTWYKRLLILFTSDHWKLL